MAREVEWRELGGDVGLGDLVRRPVLDRAQHQGDDALGDRRIAVGKEMQAAVGQPVG